MGVAISNRHDDDVEWPSTTWSNTRSLTRRSGPVPYLRLVPDLPESPDEAAEDWHPLAMVPGIEAAPEFARSGHAPIHLTRRGRIVIWLILLSATVTVLALLAPASQASSPSAPPRAVTVHAGDTMWSIATTALPRVAPGTAIERIRLLNHLSTNEVYTGEQILVPTS